MQESQFREFYRNEGAPTQENGSGVAAVGATSARTTPEEQIDAAHASLQAALRDELLQRILANSPGFFEQLIIDLLIAMGYGGSHKDAAAQLGAVPVTAASMASSTRIASASTASMSRPSATHPAIRWAARM